MHTKNSPEKSYMVGVGLRSDHFSHLEKFPSTMVDWFEAISENFMNTKGRPLQMLKKVREKFPVALHGVGMSIGSSDSIPLQYLEKLKTLIEEISPIIVSDHICWSRTQKHYSHDLLPLPLTKEALERVSKNIDQAQNFLKRELVFENISYYFSYKKNQMDESEFISHLCQKTGCGILLDFNNIYVNSVNHHFNPYQYIDQIPFHSVRQIHLGGPSQEEGFLFDTHSTKVPDQVWKLYQYGIKKGISAPTIIEWDQDIPEFSVLEKEVLKAKKVINQSFAKRPSKELGNVSTL